MALLAGDTAFVRCHFTDRVRTPSSSGRCSVRSVASSNRPCITFRLPLHALLHCRPGPLALNHCPATSLSPYRPPAARCEHFRALFDSGMRDAGACDLLAPEGFGADALAALLTYAYTDAMLPPASPSGQANGQPQGSGGNGAGGSADAAASVAGASASASADGGEAELGMDVGLGAVVDLLHVAAYYGCPR